LAGPFGPLSGLDPKKLKGLVIDDRDAEKQGTWTAGKGLKGFVGHGYLYSTDPQATIRFQFEAPASGLFEIRIAYQAHENRASNAQVEVAIGDRVSTHEVNMRKPARSENDFESLGRFKMEQGEHGSVVLKAAGADGHLHADAVQIVPAVED